MFRTRVIAVWAVGVFVAAATAQSYRSSSARQINWTRNAEQAIKQAKSSKLPLMFWVEGNSRECNSRLGDACRVGFMDERVVYAARRFICVKVPRSSSQLRSLFAKLRVPERASNTAVFSTPGGDKIDTFSAAHQPDTFSRKMTLVFNAYRSKLFDTEINPVLQDRKAKAATLKKALKVIEKFNIKQADAAVIELLERWKTDRDMSKRGFNALAELSTKPAVDLLFAQAKTGMHSKNAATALAKCTKAAAEMMLPKLTGDDFDEMLLAYKTVTKICKVKKPKPDGFWKGKNQRLKTREIDRVRKAVVRSATRWKDSYGRYR